MLAAACERKSILLFDPLTRCLLESYRLQETETETEKHYMCNIKTPDESHAAHFNADTRKLTQTIEGAHTDCVNCIRSEQPSHITKNADAGVIISLRFLDCRTFATCSDDTTVALWDVR